MEFRVVQGDITDQQADALVNAANTDLQMGGGVAEALRDAPGEAIQRKADEKPTLEVGEAVATDAYALNAEYVLHGATMELGSGGE